jgi:ABC-type amino acid transport substrate-binding protein
MGKVLELIPNLFRAHARAREAIRSVHAQAMVGSNPLVLGLPRWLRWFVDTWATRVTEPNLRLQAKALSKAQVLAAARVDISIAQLTLTTDRMAEALFSESYFVAHLSALHSSGVSLPASFAGWTGSVGVTDGSAPAAQAGSYFPHATIRTYPNVEAAIAALAKKAVALVFDDDVILRPYSGPDLELDTIEGPEQPFAIAMALGSRSLLNAVDSALRNFKRRDANGLSRWDASMSAAFPGPHGDPPDLNNRKTLANIGRSSVALPAASAISGMDGSLDAIRRRGVLRVGIHCEVPGLCIEDDGRYVGLEPDVAYYIAGQIFDTPNPKVEFVTLHEDERLTASRSPLWFLDPLRKLFSMLTTVAAANWWNLGMAGKLPKFLCPPECIGTLDFVGLDYYWGFNSIAGALRLPAALECRYASAPVWPRGLYNLLISEYRRFPGKPLMVIENGCVPVADNVSRPDYLTQHIRELERAAEKGVPVRAYLCWSITSNREWGLPFDGNSDFGLYHIELDSDPLLTRMLAPGRDQYAQIIQRRSAL